MKINLSCVGHRDESLEVPSGMTPREVISQKFGSEMAFLQIGGKMPDNADIRWFDEVIPVEEVIITETLTEDVPTEPETKSVSRRKKVENG